VKEEFVLWVIPAKQPVTFLLRYVTSVMVVFVVVLFGMKYYSSTTAIVKSTVQ
jgi:hypothetical protein